ncbi:MAG: glutaredoxin family protein [Solirubrobacteraceae bacterium]|nr:glutaredoxin family protein [Solirubrobacteraceae bacterium]
MYSRPGCHLCEEALVELAPLAAAAKTTVREVDIDGDDALLLAHLERIPVVLVDGNEVCTFFVDAPAVRAALDHRPPR